MKKTIILILLLSFQFVYSVDIQSYRYTNSLAYQGLESAWSDNPATGSELDWIVVGAYSYFYKPLVFEDPAGGSLRNTFVENSKVFHIGAGVKLFGGFLSFNTAYVWQSGLKDLNQNLVGDRSGIQDLNLRWKKILFQNSKNNFALSIIPQLTLPTGKTQNYLSDDKLGFGLEFAAEKRLKHFDIVGNLGFNYTKDAVTLNLDREKLLLTALGIRVPFGRNKTWASTLEWRRNWSFPLTSDYRPSEVHLSVQKYFRKYITAFASFGTSNPTKITSDSEGSNYRFLAGVKIHSPMIEKRCRETTQSEITDSVTVYFDFDKDKLTKKSLYDLDQLIKLLKSKDGKISSIALASHTDSRGTDNYNLKLSLKRSKSVTDYLIRNGINPRYILERFWGEESPYKTNAKSDQDYQLNRRSNITIKTFEISKQNRCK